MQSKNIYAEVRRLLQFNNRQQTSDYPTVLAGHLANLKKHQNQETKDAKDHAQRYGYTLLMLAVSHQNFEAIKQLTKTDPDSVVFEFTSFNDKNDPEKDALKRRGFVKNDTALTIAMRIGQEKQGAQLVRSLLEGQSNANKEIMIKQLSSKPPNLSHSFFMEAIRQYKVDILEVLSEFGAKLKETEFKVFDEMYVEYRGKILDALIKGAKKRNDEDYVQELQKRVPKFYPQEMKVIHEQSPKPFSFKEFWGGLWKKKETKPAGNVLNPSKPEQKGKAKK